MKAELIKTFRFEAAHSLDRLPEGHKCRRMHGHSYRLDVHLEGQVDPVSGMVIDFHEVVRLVKPLLELLDHQLLNDVPGLENSTSENICAFLWGRIKPSLPQLSALTLWESDTSRCVFRG